MEVEVGLWSPREIKETKGKNIEEWGIDENIEGRGCYSSN